MAYPVNTPGFAIDGATAELLIAGQPLTQAVESMKWSRSCTEEIIHYFGEKNPIERTGGTNEYPLEGSMGMRQFMLLTQALGGYEVLQDLELTWVLNLRPKRDSNIYTFTWDRFRITKDDYNTEMKGKAMVNFSGQALSMQMRVGG